MGVSMKYPLALEDLACWEEWLNHLNHECIVPASNLSKALFSEDMTAVLQRHVKSHQNIPYHSVQSHLSKRYINEAWIWAHVLQPLLPVQKISELCAGASIVVDLALSYLGFDQSLTKIDYQSWEELNLHEIKKSYQHSFINLNVITDTDLIPETEMIILNHSIDDLYIGLWNERHQGNYWGEFCDCDKVDASWELAMEERDIYLPILKTFIKKLTTRLKCGGHLIIRDYPSAYETHRKHLRRINFTREITQLLLQELTHMTQHIPELESAYPPSVQETFFIFRV
jgi:hypothetical protein